MRSSRRAPLGSLLVLVLALASTGCGSAIKAVDADGDGFTPSEGDCWDAVEGPAGSNLSGAEIHPEAEDPPGDGIDQDCMGGLEYDLDGDGYEDVAQGGADCDDGDAAVSPEATESCNELDDDCDGLVDDDDPSLELGDWYLDGDGDGYGGEPATASSCSPPEGYADVDGDCDDASAEAYPGAPERCDTVDTDCDGDARDDESVDAETFYADGDDDGYGDAGSTTNSCDLPAGYAENDDDCDDADAAVSPEGVEVCNDQDDDCDEAVDEDPSGAPRWYQDGDGDGHGTPDASVEACDAPEGYVEDALDCDDDDDAVSPEAVEICNGLDDDCDDALDEDDPDLDEGTLADWYPDEDGDSFGAEDGLVSACDAPGADWADIGGDCDDSDGSVYPGAEEICGSGVIEDCDLDEEAARDTCLDDALTRADADAARYASSSSIGLGDTVAAAGDVDGDGLADLLVGAPSSTGGVYLISGELDRGASSLAGAGTYTARRTGGGTEQLGRGLGGGADLDGDGYDDITLGAPDNDTGASNAGAAYVEFGPVTGSSAASGSAVVLLGSVANQSVGWALGVGDLTGDGAADWLVGVPGYKDGSDTDAGAAYVVAGPLGAGSYSVGDAADYEARVVGADAGDELGYAVAAAGDVDGDGLEDLLLAAPGNDDGGAAAGKVLLLLGPAESGAVADLADLSFRGDAGDEAGSALAALGDVDGDGLADWLIGAPGHDVGAVDKAGAALLFLGDDVPPLSVDSDDATASLVGLDKDDALGASVSGGIDLDSDGLGDLLVGVAGDDDGGAGAGAAWLVSGLSAGTVALGDAGVVLEGTAAGEALGTAVAGVGDTDGDGWADLVLGAPGYDSTTRTDAGAIFLFARWY